MADPTMSVSVPELQHGACVRVIQMGEYLRDGEWHRIKPVICQGYLDVERHYWVRGCYNADDPSRSFCMDGISAAELERLDAYWWQLVLLSMPED